MNKKNKILFLADARSAHTSRWAGSLKARGFTIEIFSLNSPMTTNYSNLGITVHSMGIRDKIPDDPESKFQKIVYLKYLFKLRKLIRECEPDIVHAHYATSYGLLGALSGFHPLIMSVWGSDVYEFPVNSVLHKSLFQFILRRADAILSTSRAMAEEIKKYTNKNISITPFGVDIEKFVPKVEPDTDQIVIGSIKKLESQYGTDLMIKSFEFLVKDLKYENVKLLIVGWGDEAGKYKRLAAETGLIDKIDFKGYASGDEVLKYYRQIDIFLNLSRRESFGVSVLEASSCGIPVIASDVGGLPEVVVNEQTGFLIPEPTPETVAEKIKLLIENPDLRKEMGRKGREFVQTQYSSERTTATMTSIYRHFIDNQRT